MAPKRTVLQRNTTVTKVSDYTTTSTIFTEAETNPTTVLLASLPASATLSNHNESISDTSSYPGDVAEKSTYMSNIPHNDLAENDISPPPLLSCEAHQCEYTHDSTYNKHLLYPSSSNVPCQSGNVLYSFIGGMFSDTNGVVPSSDIVCHNPQESARHCGNMGMELVSVSKVGTSSSTSISIKKRTVLGQPPDLSIKKYDNAGAGSNGVKLANPTISSDGAYVLLSSRKNNAFSQSKPARTNGSAVFAALIGGRGLKTHVAASDADTTHNGSQTATRSQGVTNGCTITNISQAIAEDEPTPLPTKALPCLPTPTVSPLINYNSHDGGIHNDMYGKPPPMSTSNISTAAGKEPLISNLVNSKQAAVTEPSLPSPSTNIPYSMSQKQRLSSSTSDPLMVSKNPTNSSFYGLPPAAERLYRSRGIKSLYDWQHYVLTREDVDRDRCNFVYSLPTSGGKTIVAEVLLMRCLLRCSAFDGNITSLISPVTEIGPSFNSPSPPYCSPSPLGGSPAVPSNTHTACMFVLPFVSIAEEKCAGLRAFGEALNFTVEGYYGIKDRYPAPTTPSIFVCTIEKANSLYNHLCEEGRRHSLGCVVIDELHMVGSSRRGIVLELLLSKISLLSPGTQIIGMSATVPNLPEIARWLRAAYYIGDFRPVPLKEHLICHGVVIAKSDIKEKRFDPKNMPSGDDHMRIVELLTEHPGSSTIVFCATRYKCVEYSQKIVNTLTRLGLVASEKKAANEGLVSSLQGAGQEYNNLAKIIPFGVAYHTGALSLEEREIIEKGFRSKQIHILCATSTLAAGVNLPARRVVFLTPYIGRELLGKSQYLQMCGRAGRAGLDDHGESYLVCAKRDHPKAIELMTAGMEAIFSSVFEEKYSFSRFLLEMVAIGICSIVSPPNSSGSVIDPRLASSPLPPYTAPVRWTDALLFRFTANFKIPKERLLEAIAIVESHEECLEDLMGVGVGSLLNRGAEAAQSSDGGVSSPLSIVSTTLFKTEMTPGGTVRVKKRRRGRKSPNQNKRAKSRGILIPSNTPVCVSPPPSTLIHKDDRNIGTDSLIHSIPVVSAGASTTPLADTTPATNKLPTRTILSHQSTTLPGSIVARFPPPPVVSLLPTILSPDQPHVLGLHLDSVSELNEAVPDVPSNQPGNVYIASELSPVAGSKRDREGDACQRDECSESDLTKSKVSLDQCSQATSASPHIMASQCSSLDSMHAFTETTLNPVELVVRAAVKALEKHDFIVVNKREIVTLSPIVAENADPNTHQMYNTIISERAKPSSNYSINNEDVESKEVPTGERTDIRTQTISPTKQEFFSGPPLYNYLDHVHIDLTPFGKSTVKSCFTIDEALIVRQELQQLQERGVILSDDLHTCYFVTPIRDMASCNWEKYRNILNILSDTRQRIASAVGVDFGLVHQFSALGMSGLGETGSPTMAAVDPTDALLPLDTRRRQLFTLKRFFSALCLSDILNEVAPGIIEARYDINAGQQQTLLRSASIFSASMVSFCNTMEWFSLEALIKGYMQRLGFGVKPDILPLMEISGVKAPKARALYAAGYRTPALLAVASPDEVFQKVKEMNAKDCKAAQFFTRRSAAVTIREANVLLYQLLRDKKGELLELENLAKTRHVVAATSNIMGTYGSISRPMSSVVTTAPPHT